jgi:hypothetical protein
MGLATKKIGQLLLAISRSPSCHNFSNVPKFNKSVQGFDTTKRDDNVSINL